MSYITFIYEQKIHPLKSSFILQVALFWLSLISQVALFGLCLISSLLPSIILPSMQCFPLFISALFADKQERLSSLQRLQGAIFSQLFSGKFTQIKAIAITAITGSNFIPDFSPESLLKSKLSPLQRLQGATFPQLFSGKFAEIKAIAITMITGSDFLQLSWENSIRQKGGDEFDCALEKNDRKQAIARGLKRRRRNCEQEIA